MIAAAQPLLVSAPGHAVTGGAGCEDARRRTAEPSPASDVAQLVVRERPLLARAARHLTGNYHDAEDLVQETMICALRGAGGYQPAGNFRGWVMRILYHAFCSARRRTKQRVAALAAVHAIELDDVGLASEAPAGPGGQPEQVLLGGLADDEIEAALAALPDGFRQVLELAALRELSYAEIGESMDLPVGTVRSRLSRARQRLRDELADYAAHRGLLLDGSPDEDGSPGANGHGRRPTTSASAR